MTALLFCWGVSLTYCVLTYLVTLKEEGGDKLKLNFNNFYDTAIDNIQCSVIYKKVVELYSHYRISNISTIIDKNSTLSSISAPAPIEPIILKTPRGRGAHHEDEAFRRAIAKLGN